MELVRVDMQRAKLLSPVVRLRQCGSYAVPGGFTFLITPTVYVNGDNKGQIGHIGVCP